MYEYINLLLLFFQVNHNGKSGYSFQRTCLTDVVPWESLAFGCYTKSDMWRHVDEKTFPYPKSDVSRLDAFVCSSALCNDEPMNTSNFCGSGNTGSVGNLNAENEGGDSGGSTFAQHSFSYSILVSSLFSLSICVFF